jgi:hypothetical protein
MWKNKGNKTLSEFGPFWENLAKISAADLSGRIYFYSALLSFAAEESASWEYCSSLPSPW